MANELLHKRKKFLSRRNVIIYVLTMILVLGLVAGFTNAFHGDNARYSATYGETIVIESEPPKSGSPSDHDVLNNLKFAAYSIHHATSFRGDTKGTASADLGIGKYVQNLTNTRYVVGGNKVFAETKSTSRLKNLGEQKYIEDDIVIYRPYEEINGDNVTFSDSAYRMSFKEYSDNYGSVPNQLSKYIISEQTIIGVRDENAAAPQTSGALTSADGDIDFEVPSSLVADGDGHYKFTLFLDPVSSSLYYRNEVRTLAGADSNPNFYSVQVTIEIDSNWMPISTRTVENYDIEIPVLGKMNCTGDNYEVFSCINDDTLTIPEREFFDPYVAAAKDSPDYVPPPLQIEKPLSASDYLAAAFGDYINGRELDLTCDVVLNKGGQKLTALYDAAVGVDLKNTDVKVKLKGGVGVRYAAGKVYLVGNGLNGYVNTDAFTSVLDEQNLAALLPLSLSSIDLNKILGGELLDVVFADSTVKKENGRATVPMNFNLDLSSVVPDMPALSAVNVKANIVMRDEDKALEQIDGVVSFGDYAISLNVKPLASFDFPSTDGAKDLSALAEFVPDIMATASQKSFGICGEIEYNGMPIAVDAYIDITDGLVAEGTVNVLGADVAFKYLGGNVYLSAYGAKVCGTLEQAFDLLTELTGSDLTATLNRLKSLLPATLNGYINMLDTVDMPDENTVNIGLKFMGIPLSVGATRANGKLASLFFAANVNILNIKAKVDAALALSYPDRRDVKPFDGEYITFDELGELLADVKPYLESDGYSITLGGTVADIPVSGALELSRAGSIAACGNIAVDGLSADLTYIDGTAYISLGNIKVKLGDLANSPLIGAAMGLIDMPEPELALSSLTYNDGALNLVAAVNGQNATASINFKTGLVCVNGALGNINAALNLMITPKSGVTVVAPQNADEYSDLNDLAPAIPFISKVLADKAVSLDLSISYGNAQIEATADVNFDGALKARIACAEYGLDITVIGNEAYVSIGTVKLHGTFEQLFDMISSVDQNLDAALSSALGAFDITSLPALIKSLDISSGKLSATVEFNGISASLVAATDLSSIRSTVNISGEQIGLNITPLGVAAPVCPPAGEYNEFSAIGKVLPAVLDCARSAVLGFDLGITAGGEQFDIDGSVLTSDSTASAVLGALGTTVELYYNNGTVYAAASPIKLKLATGDINAVLPDVTKLLGALGIALPQIDLGAFDLNTILNSLFGTTDIFEVVKNAVNLITGFSATDSGITIAVNVKDIALDISLSANAGGVTVGVSHGDIALDGQIMPTTVAPASPVGEFADIASVTPALGTIADCITRGGLNANAKVSFAGMTLDAALAVNLKGDVSIAVEERTLNLNATVVGGRAYIKLGSIAVSGSLDELTELLGQVFPNLPEFIRPYMLAMNDQIMAIMPTADELYTDGALDTNKLVALALGVIKSFDQNGNALRLCAERRALSLDLNIDGALDIFGNATLSFDNIGGPFGEHYAMPIDFELGGISASAVTVATPDPNEYVPLGDVLGAIDCALPLIASSVLDIGLDLSVGGNSVIGNAYIDLGEYSAKTVEARFTLDVAGVPVAIAVKNGLLGVDINNGKIALTQPLDSSSLGALVAELDTAIPELKLAEKLNSLKSELGGDILSQVSLYPSENGFTVALGSITVAVESANGVLNAINITSGDTAIKLTCSESDGTLNSVSTSITAGGIDIGASLDIATAQKTDTPDITGIALSSITPMIKPVLDLAQQVKSAPGITVPLAATLTVGGSALAIDGAVTVNFDPFTVYADITLFADSPQHVYIRYIQNVLYIDSGSVRLSFDTVNDMNELKAALSDYIPPALKNGGGSLSAVTSAIDAIKNLAAASTPAQTVDALFAKNAANKKSALSQIASLLALTQNGDELIAELTILDGTPFDLIVNVTPRIAGNKVGAEVNTALGSLASVTAHVEAIALTQNSPATVPTAQYVSVAQFVQKVIYAVNTLTASAPTVTTTDENGVTTTVKTTAFEVSDFAFDYDMFKVAIGADGQPVIDPETGRKVIETDSDGNKFIERRVSASNIPGEKALKFKYVTTDNGTASTSKLYLEAHLKIDIKDAPTETDENGNTVTKSVTDATKSKNGFPIELNLYLAPTPDCPQGLAYLYYKEANGFGEQIAIDYNSVLQIVAAVMDIVGADDATIDSLLKDYRLKIDSSVFDSMAIAGFDSIRSLLDGGVRAVNSLKSALGNGKSALKKLYSVTDLSDLADELQGISCDGQLSIKELLSSTMDNLQKAIAQIKTALGSDTQAADEAPAKELNGALFGKIVNAIEFFTDGNMLGANVDNSIATGTSDTARVTVSSNHSGEKPIIDAITVSNLDVNTQKLTGFNLVFATGDKVGDIAIPNDYNTSKTNSSYSDFGNLKHILFDIMNTANMLEFEIGGFENTDDVINLHLKLGVDWLANLDISIKFKASVKIIKTGEIDGVPQYKTGASIELRSSASPVKIFGIGSTMIMPLCTTRLFFWDDMIYVSGISDWSMGNERVNGLFDYEYVMKSATYVNVAYSVEELSYMLSHDMNRLLDEFLYYLLPITKESFFGQNIRGIISDQITGSSGSGTTENTQNTLAQIFKGYTYDGSSHRINIGLAELAGSSSLSDLILTLTGRNDGDDNILDNFVHKISVSTSIAGMIDVKLNATLSNATVSDVYYLDGDFTSPAPVGTVTDYKRVELSPAPLSPITLDMDKAIFEFKGTRYYRTGNSTNYRLDKGSDRPHTIDPSTCTYYTLEQFIDSQLVGGGISWQRIWQDAALAA